MEASELEHGKPAQHNRMLTVLRDRALALFLVVGGAMLWGAAQRIPNERAHDPLGAQFFPELVGILLVLTGGGVLLPTALSRLKRQADSPGDADSECSGAPPTAANEGVADALPYFSGQRFAGGVTPVVVLAVLYLCVLPLVGYIASTLVVMGALLAVLGIRRWGTLILLSTGTTAAIYAVFTFVLRIRLP